MTRRLRRGDRAPDVGVLDAHGRPFQLARLWQAGPVMLNFLRHFG